MLEWQIFPYLSFINFFTDYLGRLLYLNHRSLILDILKNVFSLINLDNKLYSDDCHSRCTALSDCCSLLQVSLVSLFFLYYLILNMYPFIYSFVFYSHIIYIYCIFYIVKVDICATTHVAKSEENSQKHILSSHSH